MSEDGWDIILGEWGWVGHYFGWVEVSGALCWVGGARWCIILGGWEWVGMSGRGWG